MHKQWCQYLLASISSSMPFNIMLFLHNAYDDVCASIGYQSIAMIAMLAHIIEACEHA